MERMSSSELTDWQAHLLLNERDADRAYEEAKRNNH
jgi:hypothetical protein